MFFFFSSRRRHTRLQGDWSSDVCSSDLVLEAQHGLFGQDGVDDGERSLAVGHVLQRDVGAFAPLFTLLVMDDRVAVGGGAAAAGPAPQADGGRTGEHTTELQSPWYLVCR